jgi:exonuclease III
MRTRPQGSPDSDMRVITWNVARRSSRLAEQAAALAAREPDVVALQEITDTTLPMWRAVLPHIGLAHVWASLDDADPSRAPARRRQTGVLVGSRTALSDASTTLDVPWPETAVAAVVAADVGPVEIHCLHVPNAANGWIKPRTLAAIRNRLVAAPATPRVVCGDFNTPRRELESGEVISFARDSHGRLRSERGAGRGGARRRPGIARPRLPGRLSIRPRLRVARAELDLAANLGAWRRLAPRSSVHLCRA